jgi:hypothetical protein
MIHEYIGKYVIVFTQPIICEAMRTWFQVVKTRNCITIALVDIVEQWFELGRRLLFVNPERLSTSIPSALNQTQNVFGCGIHSSH